MPTIGSHCILELYECPPAVLDDLELVREALIEAARISKSTLLSQTAHRFDPQGVTALGLLADSHISVHTWPELGYAAADVFTCGPQCEPERACEYLAAALQAGRVELQVLDRGGRSPTVRPARVAAPVAAATTSPSDRSSAG